MRLQKHYLLGGAFTSLVNFGLPRNQKIGMKQIGFEVVKLERKADMFGREFGREFFGGGAEALKKQGQNIRGKTIEIR